MWLDGGPALHVLGTHKHFHNAVVLRNMTALAIWYSFVECWASLYVEHPNVIRLDQESSFKLETFRQLCTAQSIELQLSGVESHNSLGPRERYHETLRGIFKIIRNRNPDLEPDIALRYDVKAINDTTGPEGLVPSLLVFGVIPSFSLISKDLPRQKERIDAMRIAKKEMAVITSELRVVQAQISKLPLASKYLIAPEQEVGVSLERSERSEGHFTVTRVC